MTTRTKEIDKLEKMIGNDLTPARRNRQASKAIKTLREIWAEEPLRRQGDIHALLTNLDWRWPLRIWTREQLEIKSKELGEILKDHIQNR